MQKIRKAQLKKYWDNVKVFPKEHECHGHPWAALSCMGLTFTDDVSRFMEWLRENNQEMYRILQESSGSRFTPLE